MDLVYRPWNAPWVVDLDLACAEDEMNADSMEDVELVRGCLATRIFACFFMFRPILSYKTPAEEPCFPTYDLYTGTI